VKTDATLVLERNIRQATRKIGVYGCQEVTIGSMGHDRVDYMTYEPTKDIFRCYEIKVSISDFHSDAVLSFCGHYNYYVLTKELYEKVKNEIPADIGVYIGETCVKRAKHSDMPDTRIWRERRTVDGRSTMVERPFREVLITSLIRSLYRDSEKLYAAGNEQYVSRLKRAATDAVRKERKMEKKYRRFFDAVADRYGAEKALKLAKKAEK
jgi:hypothetical protein